MRRFMSRTNTANNGSGLAKYTAEISTGKVMPDNVVTSVAKFRTVNCCFNEVFRTPQSTAPLTNQRSRGCPITWDAAVKPKSAMPSSLTLLTVPEVSVSSHPSGKCAMAWLRTADTSDSRPTAAELSCGVKRTKNCAPPSCLKTVAETVMTDAEPNMLAEHISIRPVASAVLSKA